MQNRNISNRFVSDYDVELQRGEGKVPDKREDHRIKHIQQWTVGKRNGPDSSGLFLFYGVYTIKSTNSCYYLKRLLNIVLLVVAFIQLFVLTVPVNFTALYKNISYYAASAI